MRPLAVTQEPQNSVCTCLCDCGHPLPAFLSLQPADNTRCPARSAEIELDIYPPHMPPHRVAQLPLGSLMGEGRRARGFFHHLTPVTGHTAPWRCGPGCGRPPPGPATRCRRRHAPDPASPVPVSRLSLGSEGGGSHG